MGRPRASCHIVSEMRGRIHVSNSFGTATELSKGVLPYDAATLEAAANGKAIHTVCEAQSQSWLALHRDIGRQLAWRSL